MTDKFAHLHVHSTYSPLDGMIRIPELVEKVSKLKQRAVAVTDHGIMSGAPILYMEAKKKDIIPIIGQEFYITPDASDKSSRNNFHIVLLALNEEGYRLIVELSSIANLRENYHYDPRIDWNILKEYRKGMKNIAALTACMSGELQRSFNDKTRETQQILEFYRRIFPNLYLELQYHRVSIDPTNLLSDIYTDNVRFDRLQKENFSKLLDISDEFNIPVVLTGDAHYLDRADYQAHDVMLAMQTRSDVNATKRFRFNGSEYYVASGHHMRRSLLDFNDINSIDCWNRSLDGIADIVKNTKGIIIPEFEKRTFHIPHYRNNSINLVKKLCEIAIQKYDFEPEYWQRYLYEIAIIEQANFADEILIVKDYVDWARNSGIERGKGRGSMVGVLVSFLLGITDIDPIKYDLSFERAINPDRPSLPDFDVDFEDERRKEVFGYLKTRWGEENIIQVGTINTLAPRGVIGALMRTHGYSFQDRIAVTKTLPSLVEVSNVRRKASIEEIIESEVSEKLQQVLIEHPEIADIASRLQGIVSGKGAHAAGVVISDSRKPVKNYIPTMLVASSGVTVSQYDMYALGRMGFIKFDVLGLKTLSVISQAKKFIGKDPFLDIDITKDIPTLEMLDKCDLLTIFELQGAASVQAVKILGVKDFNDVIALQALSRGGASQFIPEYKEGRDGSKVWKKKLKKIHPELVNILGSTYGTVVYQEQVMDIGRKVAGFTWTNVDKIKDAIKHKSSREFIDLQEPFFSGCKANSVSEEGINIVWSMIERYCSYGFNKSHSVAYASICQQTAYLKCHYPKEWFAAYLNHAAFTEYAGVIENARFHGVTIYPPDINISEPFCIPYKEGILYGLSLIKGVGASSSGAISELRPKRGFQDEDELRATIPKRNLNSRVYSTLRAIGALNSLGLDITPTGEEELKHLGVFVHSHPLDLYKQDLEAIYNDPDNAKNLTSIHNSTVMVGGIVSRVKEIVTKNDDKMGFVSLSYYGKEYELTVFPNQWDKKRYTKGKVIIIEGTRQVDRGSIVVINIADYP